MLSIISSPRHPDEPVLVQHVPVRRRDRARPDGVVPAGADEVGGVAVVVVVLPVQGVDEPVLEVLGGSVIKNGSVIFRE